MISTDLILLAIFIQLTMDKVRRRFDEADSNHDGNLDRGEFLNLLKSFGVTLDADELTKMFREADVNGDGTITFQEFRDTCVGNKVQEIEMNAPQQKRSQLRRNSGSSDKRAEPLTSSGKHFSRKIGIQRGRSGLGISATVTWGGDDHIDCVHERVLTEAEMKESCKYFWSCNVSGSGRLSKQEFVKLLNELGLSVRRKNAERAFEIADASKDGSITFAAFFQTYVRQCSKHIRDILVRNLTVHYGYITKTQCLNVLSKFGCNPDNNKTDKMMASMKMSKDGCIAIEQLYSFLGID